MCNEKSCRWSVGESSGYVWWSNLTQVQIPQRLKKYRDFVKFRQLCTNGNSMNPAFNLYQIAVSSRLYLLTRAWKMLLFSVASWVQSHHDSGISWPVTRKTIKIEFHIRHILFAHMEEKWKRCLCIHFGCLILMSSLFFAMCLVFSLSFILDFNSHTNLCL